jgi:hypothetical protein
LFGVCACVDTDVVDLHRSTGWLSAISHCRTHLGRCGCEQLNIGPRAERIVYGSKREPECDIHGGLEDFPLAKAGGAERVDLRCASPIGFCHNLVDPTSQRRFARR